MIRLFWYTTITGGDVTFAESQDKANILNDYFCTVFSHDDTENLPDMGDSTFSNIPSIELDSPGNDKILKDPSKAAGPDGLPARYVPQVNC